MFDQGEMRIPVTEVVGGLLGELYTKEIELKVKGCQEVIGDRGPSSWGIGERGQGLEPIMSLIMVVF